MRILVVDDNGPSLQSLCLVLNDLGHEAVGCQDPAEALERARKEIFPLIITDIRMPGLDGLELLTLLKTNTATTGIDVVLITGHGDMATAVEALRKGAYDYLNKPINARELAAVVDRCAERQSLLLENTALKSNLEQEVSRVAGSLREDLQSVRNRLRELEGIGHVIAESPQVQQLMSDALIMHGDPSVPVLLEGETGTGKEIFARVIHFGDEDNAEPFIAINCSAIPHELFESELFGYESGAFTGGRAEGASGKLEQAGKGTLFLDEVAEMPITLQPKLLRVLEERSFYRVGGVKKRKFNARIVCAGNRNMEDMVERGQFRRDLYHRLRVGHILIPPLRERPEDIIAMANHFLQRETQRKKKNFAGLDERTRDILLRYPWPGNVRELENTIERAVLLYNGDSLMPAHVHFLENLTRSGPLPPARPVPAQAVPLQPGLPKEAAAASLPSRAAPLTERPVPPPLPAGLLAFSLADNTVQLPDNPFSLDHLENAVVAAALARFDGNKSKAALFLGISRFALHRRVQSMEKE